MKQAFVSSGKDVITYVDQAIQTLPMVQNEKEQRVQKRKASLHSDRDVDDIEMTKTPSQSSSKSSRRDTVSFTKIPEHSKRQDILQERLPSAPSEQLSDEDDRFEEKEYRASSEHEYSTQKMTESKPRTTVEKIKLQDKV